MVHTRKIISVLLIVTLFAGCIGLSVNAADSLLLPDYTMSDAEWDKYWSTVEGDNTYPIRRQTLCSPAEASCPPH